MPREIGIWSYTLRPWQVGAFQMVRKYCEELKKFDFLADVCPAGGKTTFALRSAFYFLQLRYVKRIVVVVHTEHLKKQWSEAATKFDIDLDPNFQNNGHFKETDDYHGICVTYQQVGNNPTLHKWAVDQIPTLVIIDEIHHAGEDKNWGTGLQTAYEHAKFRLCLTGTAFRSDDNPIPFVTYVDGVSKPDYRYTYTKAIIDNVCRVIYFPAYDGIMKWTVDNTEFQHTFSDYLDEARSSERLRTALDPRKSKWLEHVIRDANAKLDEIRNVEHHSAAGGLILATDQNHAKEIARLVIKICNEVPEIVISEDPEASNKIKKYREGFSKWIIAVKMISEGVDIPRLRVGVYANNIRKDLFFRQVVGRFVRWLHYLPKQEAYLFIPKDPGIVQLAREIEIERDHALGQADPEWKKERAVDPDREEKEFETISAIVTDRTQYELGLTDKIASMFGIDTDKAVDIAKPVIEQRRQNTEDSRQNKAEDPLYLKRENLRKQINQTAKLVAKNVFGQNGNRIDWEYAHKEWLKRGGKNIEQETIKELKRRLSWLERQL